LKFSLFLKKTPFFSLQIFEILNITKIIKRGELTELKEEKKFFVFFSSVVILYVFFRFNQTKGFGMVFFIKFKLII